MKEQVPVNTKPVLLEEKNLSLEAYELDKKIQADRDRSKELMAKGESFEKDGKKFIRFKADSEEKKEYERLQKSFSEDIDKSVNISEYKSLASPPLENSSRTLSIPSEMGAMRRMQEENKKEIDKISGEIGDLSAKLNALRAKLDMPETDDIPSLSVKKHKLEELQEIQKVLEGKLDFETKKQEVKSEEDDENKKREGRYLNEALATISSDVQKLHLKMEDRKAGKLNPVFELDADLGAAATKIGDSKNLDDIKSSLAKLENIVSDFTDNRARGVNDNAESLRDVAQKLKRISAGLHELPSKFKDEEEKRSIGQSSNAVAEKVDQAITIVLERAQALEKFMKIQ